MSLSSQPYSTLNSPSDIASQRLAADPSALDALRLQAKNDPKGALKAMGGQFEALFLGTLMKQMRETSFDDSDGGSEMSTYRSLLDEQMVQVMGKSGGIGIGAMLTRSIARNAGLDGNSDTGGSGNIVASTDGSRSMGTQNLPPGFTEALQRWRAQGAQTAGDSSNAQDSSNISSSQSAFINTLLPQAQNAAAQLGVAPGLLVAQAALETGWGRKAIRQPDGSDSHNLFGIKAGSNWTGPVANVTTTEYVHGTVQKQVQAFRVYGSYQEAFDDYARLLANSPRYQKALNQGSNGAAFGAGLQGGGYATDPDYARKLAAVAGQVQAQQDAQSSLALASR
jgi:flagellar protein FlgJ